LFEGFARHWDMHDLVDIVMDLEFSHGNSIQIPQKYQRRNIGILLKSYKNQTGIPWKYQRNIIEIPWKSLGNIN